MALGRRHNDAGFTLVEILCVLALLGLTAGMVVLNLPRGEDPLVAEVQGFATQLNIAARESAIDGRIRGVEIDGRGYTLMQYAGDWTVIRSADWTHVQAVDLSIEDQSIDLKARAKILAAAEDETLAPLLTLDPMGGVTEFTLDLDGRETGYSLAPDLRGRVMAEPLP